MKNYDELPERLRGGMQRYIEDRIKPGGFLTAVLSNDLAEACARADAEMRVELWNIVCWVYNEAPGNCWGSPEEVKEWLAG